MKPLTGVWKRHNLAVRLAEDDTNTNLSNLRCADDSLFIGGSLEHTTTMLHDLTTAATASPIRHESAEEATRWQFKE